MVDTPGHLEIHVLKIGACLFCGVDRLGTPDDPPVPGSAVICGGCAGLHILEAEYLDEEWVVPRLAKPGAFEREELLRRPDVRAIRDAYQLDQVEARMRRNSRKDKRPSAPRTGGRVTLGRNRLEARGPDA